ncbi:MAG: cytochrome o ubiquinol oxidase subunit [Chlamydiota bacterium]|jgi:cytochrome o ubiquinol oxidase subunit 1
MIKLPTNWQEFFFGRLTWAAFEHDYIEYAADASMVFAALLSVALLFYYKKWTWLWKEWITSLDPKKIGVMYMVVAAIMLFKGLFDAGMMRAQQAFSVGDSFGYLSESHFQQVFTAHGTTMIFFVGMAVVFGMMNLALPLQIGARDVAYPFLNSLGFWLFAVGALLINLSLIIGNFSAAGWLSYPPLSGIYYSPDVGMDYWIWTLEIAGVGSLISGINFLATILKMRCPGMTLMKMPIFAWSCLGSLVLIIFAFPILTATITMLCFDRTLGMHFFTGSHGGNQMMYINLIWAWGHPEVYILVLPAFGIYSEVVATFSEKRLFGYTSMVWAIVAITLLSFIVWLHHFFTMGAGANVNAFFGIMTMLIAIPTGVKVFNWLFTMYQGRVHMTTPMLWFMGFITTFTIGGMTGVLMSVPAIDFQVHNSLFLIAHFHSVIIGGVVFGLFSGATYWFPKILGFQLNERIGTWAFWFWFIGFLCAFMPLYLLGLMGATRRLDHYTNPEWQPLFLCAGVGVFLIAIGTVLQGVQIVVSVLQRKQRMDTTGDPWNGRTLEWATASPPPLYNFAVLPEVHDRDPFWAIKQAGKVSQERPPYEPIHMPKDSPMGFLIASFSFLFGFGIIWHMLWLMAVGTIGMLALIIYRLTDDDIEYTLSIAEIETIEKQHPHTRWKTWSNGH